MGATEGSASGDAATSGGAVPAGGSVRLVDLLAGLSLVCDLAMSHPPEESLRRALVATGLARSLDLPERDVHDVFYTAMLEHVGCTGFAHEMATMLGGDERAANAAGSQMDFGDPLDLFRTFLPELTRGADVLHRVRLVTAALVRGGRIDSGSAQANCEVAASMADRLDLGDGVRTSLYQTLELWNGKGGPRGAGGDDLTVAIRLTHVASVAVLFCRLGGPDLAIEAVRRRAGGMLDPDLVADFERVGPDLLAAATDADAVAAVVDAEPTPVRRIAPPRLEAVARAIGDMVDLKSPHLHGHAAAVGDLADAAGAQLQLDEAADGRLRLAGLLHDIGRAGVASGIWDKPGELSVGEWEQVRLHAHHTERILSRSATLSAIAPLAGAHHERCDGSGYHRGTGGSGLSMPARVLAAADAFAAMTADRPHRPALKPDAAADVLAADAEAGRLDPDAVAAVLAAAGHRHEPVRRAWPAGLTDRQVEVLRLVAAGCSNREIARRLVVSPRTAEHHVQAIYTRIGASSRAAAAMFAMEHDLVG